MIWEKLTKENLEAIHNNAEIIKKNSKIEYYNISVSFDIETSSFMYEHEKAACMYVWAMCIDGHYFTGRTWSQFFSFLFDISKVFEISKNRRMIIYVHNLAYETQFIKNYFEIEKVIANEVNKPIMWLTNVGFEFRCSYLLSGYSLGTLADVYLQGRVKKLKGDLDYSLLRHSGTQLTRREYQYLYNDVRIVYEYIIQQIEKNNNSIAKIPYTKTGYVRRYLKENCIGGPPVRGIRRSRKHSQYISLMRNMTISSAEEYDQMCRAFQGGFTHTSCFNQGTVFNDVSFYDFTSSYPTMLIAKQYPISRGWLVHFSGNHEEREAEFNNYIQKYCCIFDVEFTEIESSIIYEHYIPQYKCSGITSTDVCDNGRVVRADCIRTTITNVDFKIIKKCYTWKSMKVKNFRVYNKGYLPKPFIECILTLYNDKTQLKGVECREAEYQSAKENINSLYGACVTALVHDEYEIKDGEWITKQENIEEEIERYNKSYNRCLFYLWGVFCTAYARAALWTGIFEFKTDYIYSDTDSLKVLNAEAHKEYIERYNKSITDEINKCLDFYHFDRELSCPKTIKGVPKPLGVWDYEGSGSFKAIRAKCYMTYKHNEYVMTVAGLNKTEAVKYMHEKYGADLFSAFEDGLYIPKGRTGKMTHTYINERKSGKIIDYLGRPGSFEEMSCVHLEPAEYRMSLTESFIKFLKGVKYDGEY